jgi:hypothetical protein
MALPAWDMAYSRGRLFTHKIPTSYPQLLALQYPPYRIILYADRSKPLHVGFCAKSQAQVDRQTQALKQCFFMRLTRPGASVPGSRFNACLQGESVQVLQSITRTPTDTTGGPPPAFQTSSQGMAAFAAIPDLSRSGFTRCPVRRSAVEMHQDRTAGTQKVPN